MPKQFSVTVTLLITLFTAGQLSAQTFVVLNNDNNFTDELEPAVFLQIHNSGNGPLFGVNLEFSCSTCDLADFSDAVTLIGGGASFCGYNSAIPIEIVQNNDQFCARSTISSSKFDIDLLTWLRGTGVCFENPIGGCNAAGGFTSYLRTPFPIQSPSELLESLITAVMTLNLTKGIANSIDGKINTALQALDDMNQNNDVAAINALQAFINAIQAQRRNYISESDADALIADAQVIIDLLNN